VIAPSGIARHWRTTLPWLPLLLYVAALNPYFLPGTYDNVIYHVGGVSMAESGAFLYQGKYNIAWAPGLPALLALPYSIGPQSPLTAKLVVLMCVAAGLFLVRRFLLREGREHPALICAVLALAPCGFMMGTRIMSEWPYIAMSFLFLLCLDRLRNERRTVSFALVVGCVLGAAALTRFVGVLLGMAVVAQAVTSLRSGDRRHWCRAIIPEAIVAAVGAGAFLLWQIRDAWHVSNGTAAAENYYHGRWYVNIFLHPSFRTVPGKISDLLFHIEKVLQAVHISGSASVWLPLLIGLVAIVGMAARLASAKQTPGDWYALAVVALFAFQNKNQQVRYLLPVAPFLISYLFSGVALGAKAISIRDSRLFRFAFSTFCAVWISALALLDVYLVTFGNGQSHAGLCVVASPNAETFYLGEWRDLYNACRYIREASPEGTVAVLGGNTRYVLAFSGRPAVSFPPHQPVSYVVAEGGEEVPHETQEALGLAEVSKFGGVRVYSRNANAAHLQR